MIVPRLGAEAEAGAQPDLGPEAARRVAAQRSEAPLSLPRGPGVEPTAGAARHTRSSPAEFGLQVPDHPSVRQWQARYAPQRAAELSVALARAHPYRRHIAARLQERGLPQELLFLPVLESHYRARAVSRSGAAGIWQIMTNTSAPLGLRRNLWLDERRDFWAATEGALRKLQENYQRFGSWPLALAAYNCGAGCLTRAMRAGGSWDFWELRERGLLPRETAEYVPKFYALVQICAYPGRHGLPSAPATAGSSPRWVRVELDRSVELALLARACALPEELLVAANAELCFGITPPPAHGYALKVPAEAEGRVRAVLRDPEIELLRYQLHTVVSGDTYYGLSRHYGVAVELIQSANPGVDPRRIRVGGLLKVPVVGNVVREPPAPRAVPVLAYTGRYTVQGGDTLWAISRRYGTTPELLAAANGRGLDELLRPGETLKVPATDASAGGSPAAETERSEVPGIDGYREGSGG
ncbi:MAG: LysM peptidoglycan-binding domain-containing protein [Spirochaetales bacterium]|nr:LysM peptidoglycan-binding domain-containing protein [Spirochaetales bacterium]